MGGVNLAEESQRILGSTQFVGTQIRSVKDEIFLHLIPLQNKIRQIGESDYCYYLIGGIIFLFLSVTVNV